MRYLFVLLFGAIAFTTQASAFDQVTSRDSFIRKVEGRQLTRAGIKLTVTSGGQIIGRAFGTPVTGRWKWSGNYFCRDLYYGKRDLGSNCQMVRARGDTLRFISDRGAGQQADLFLR